jgi:hypothetical protein
VPRFSTLVHTCINTFYIQNYLLVDFLASEALTLHPLLEISRYVLMISSSRTCFREVDRSEAQWKRTMPIQIKQGVFTALKCHCVFCLYTLQEISWSVYYAIEISAQIRCPTHLRAREMDSRFIISFNLELDDSIVA